jgi:hypothetical protein
VEFTNQVVKAAWDRQRGRCAKCGRWLVWAQRGRDSVTGAWQSHHRNPGDQEGCDALANCVIFCSGIADCHFNEGHAGIDWSHHACLDDSALLFLCDGEGLAKMAPESSKSSRRSLIGAVFGVSQVAEGKRRPARKRKSKRNPEGSAKATDAKGKGTGLETATDY